MASIKAGTYTVGEILSKAGLNLEEKAATDGVVDHRRVKIGGLSFDNTEKVIEVPYTANELELTLDGKKEATLSVELDDEQKELRKRSFESAADAEDK